MGFTTIGCLAVSVGCFKCGRAIEGVPAWMESDRLACGECFKADCECLLPEEHLSHVEVEDVAAHPCCSCEAAGGEDHDGPCCLCDSLGGAL